MDEIDIEHVYSEDTPNGCYYCDGPDSGFCIEQESPGVLKILHVCRDCCSRWG